MRDAVFTRVRRWKKQANCVQSYIVEDSMRMSTLRSGHRRWTIPAKTGLGAVPGVQAAGRQWHRRHSVRTT